MQQPGPKVIPISMEDPSAPTYYPQERQDDPEQESKLTEWWRWITLQRHSPGVYFDGQRRGQQGYVQPPPPPVYSQPPPPPVYSQPPYGQQPYSQPAYSQPQQYAYPPPYNPQYQAYPTQNGY